MMRRMCGFLLLVSKKFRVAVCKGSSHRSGSFGNSFDQWLPSLNCIHLKVRESGYEYARARYLLRVYQTQTVLTINDFFDSILVAEV